LLTGPVNQFEKTRVRSQASAMATMSQMGAVLLGELGAAFDVGEGAGRLGRAVAGGQHRRRLLELGQALLEAAEPLEVLVQAGLVAAPHAQLEAVEVLGDRV
jgi:hypothetical protein